MNIFLTFLIYKLDDTQTEKTKKKKKNNEQKKKRKMNEMKKIVE